MASPADTYTWLRSFNPPLDRYAATLSRHGFETTFALGLIEDEGILSDLGIWQEDAARIMRHLSGPRSLVAQWEPFITHIPSQRVSLSEFLLMTPVPHLVSHVKALKAHGFDHVACFKNIELTDLDLMPSIPSGHKLAIRRISMGISTNCFASLPSIDIPLGIWLAHLSPPMHNYELTLSLLSRKSSLTVPELLMTGKVAIMSLPMPLGYRRTLWHYIVKERLHWLDCLT